MTERSTTGSLGPVGPVPALPPEEPTAPVYLDPSEDWRPDLTAGLVKFSSVAAAVRRSAALFCAIAVVGLLGGVGLDAVSHTPYRASTSLLLAYGPYENGVTAANDNVAIAQTRSVAELATSALGSREDVDAVLASYTVTILSNRVLVITFRSSSADEARRGAAAVAAGFLQFRAHLLEQRQDQEAASLRQQFAEVTQHVSAARAELQTLSSQAESPERKARMSDLSVDLDQGSSTLISLRQAMDDNAATEQPANAAAISGSKVLDGASLLPRPGLSRILLYPLAGLILGVAAGLSLIVIRAVVPERPRRRDEIAAALSAPVTVSTSPGGRVRLLSSRRRSRRDVERVAGEWQRLLSKGNSHIATLLVVAVDDPHGVAVQVVALATSCARRGQRVVLADLLADRQAARLLGAPRPGVRVVEAQGARLVVAVPDHDEVMPLGPDRSGWISDENSVFGDAVADACASADVLVTVVTLDPSCSHEHLSTWARQAVVVVTAGRSSRTKIKATAEIVRMAGLQLVSAAVFGADRADESVGVSVPRSPVASSQDERTRQLEQSPTVFAIADRRLNAAGRREP